MTRARSDLSSPRQLAYLGHRTGRSRADPEQWRSLSHVERMRAGMVGAVWPHRRPCPRPERFDRRLLDRMHDQQFDLAGWCIFPPFGQPHARAVGLSQDDHVVPLLDGQQSRRRRFQVEPYVGERRTAKIRLHRRILAQTDARAGKLTIVYAVAHFGRRY